MVVGGEDVANFDNSALTRKLLALVFNCLLESLSHNYY